MNDYESIIAVIFCFIVMLIGLLKIARRRKLTKRGQMTEGVVSSIQKNIKRNRITFFSVITFKTIEGKEFEVSLSDGMPFPTNTVGNKVNLVYNKDSPGEIIIISKRLAILEFFIFIIGAMGLLFFLKMFLFNN